MAHFLTGLYFLQRLIIGTFLQRPQIDLDDYMSIDILSIYRSQFSAKRTTFGKPEEDCQRLRESFHVQLTSATYRLRHYHIVCIYCKSGHTNLPRKFPGQDPRLAIHPVFPLAFHDTLPEKSPSRRPKHETPLQFPFLHLHCRACRQPGRWHPEIPKHLVKYQDYFVILLYLRNKSS